MESLEIDEYTKCGFCLTKLIASASSPDKGWCRCCKVYWQATPSKWGW